MAGQLIKRGDRTWLVRLYLARDAETGKQRFYHKTVHGTKAEAQRFLNKLLAERDTGTFRAPSKQTLGEYLREWLNGGVRHSLRSRTLASYRHLLERHVIPTLGHRQLTHLTLSEIDALYASMVEAGLAARTVRYTHAVLRGALRKAVQARKLLHNPTDHATLPRQERKEMRALSPADAARFLVSVGEDRWAALWVLLVTTGLRPGEALGLKWGDIESGRLRVQRVHVPGKGFEEPKTERSRRSVTLPLSTVAALRAHKARQNERRLVLGAEYEDNGLVFATDTGRPLDIRNLRRYFDAALKRAGLPRIRLYDLRHTCATLLLSQGEHPKVVSERLGHSTVTLTLDTYSHVLPDMQQQTAEKLEALLFSHG